MTQSCDHRRSCLSPPMAIGSQFLWARSQDAVYLGPLPQDLTRQQPSCGPRQWSHLKPDWRRVCSPHPTVVSSMCSSCAGGPRPSARSRPPFPAAWAVQPRCLLPESQQRRVFLKLGHDDLVQHDHGSDTMSSSPCSVRSKSQIAQH